MAAASNKQLNCICCKRWLLRTSAASTADEDHEPALYGRVSHSTLHRYLQRCNYDAMEQPCTSATVNTPNKVYSPLGPGPYRRVSHFLYYPQVPSTMLSPWWEGLPGPKRSATESKPPRAAPQAGRPTHRERQHHPKPNTTNDTQLYSCLVIRMHNGQMLETPAASTLAVLDQLRRWPALNQ